MKIQNSFQVTYSVDTAVEKLLFAEEQSAETKSWWREMTWLELMDRMLPEDVSYLEERFN